MSLNAWSYSRTQVYPMYKAFIEPDLQTAHIKIINKFNPFSGFQNPSYILKVNPSVSGESETYKGCFGNFTDSVLFKCSLKRQWPQSKWRRSFLQNMKKEKKKLMIYIFFHLVKILKLVSLIWGWETETGNTTLCLRYKSYTVWNFCFLLYYQAVIFMAVH